ncbi:MAG: glycosyltransferase [Methylobacterium sp.]|nr:glycosyltransferase [Methylobacterium sp.]MCA3603394.1 glycosyltransferase [Methylobacterium sp.]MCA3615079.1 glycosyltransferase [Methylobacterium sp.]
MNEFVRLGRKAPGEIRFRTAASLERPPAFRLSEALLACGLPRERLLDEVARAGEMGSDVIDLGLREGWLHEETLLREIAARLDLAFLEAPPPVEAGIGLDESLRLRSYRAAGSGREGLRVLSPDGALIRALAEGRMIAPGGRVALVTRQSLCDALIAFHGADLARKAASTLPPRFSARRPEAIRPRRRGSLLRMLLVSMLAILGLVIAFPALLTILVPALLAPLLIGGAMTTVISALASREPLPLPPALPEARLPAYTILVPLYREAGMIETLVTHLERLDYPRDRLEILLLIEADDTETRDALRVRRADLPGNMLILEVPPGEPRTKPRALNAGLPFATGELLVVYDAEDAPDPDQLKRAAAAFAVAHPLVTCMQARLAVVNAYDSLLTCRFAVDYAALFDAVKAGAARLGWPVPLGGTSNHFRTEALRRVGAWDAWNLTEDADLGIRLARLGHRVEDLPSTTWEELPATLRPWMNQRTRWMKGWMQTLIVQARMPRDLLGELGPFRLLAISLTGLSVVLGALGLPLCLLSLGLRLSMGLPFLGGPSLIVLFDLLVLVSLAAALLLETVPPLLALSRRGSVHLAPALLLAPVIYILISVAAWRALFELARHPFLWRKTPHGLIRRAGGLGSLQAGNAQEQSASRPVIMAEKTSRPA